MPEQEPLSWDAADEQLLLVARKLLAAKFVHADLANASPAKRQMFGEVVSALRLWVGARDNIMAAIRENQTDAEDTYPGDPRAKTVVDLVTPKQLWLIRSMGRDHDVDVDAWAANFFRGCSLEEISKRAASAMIERLKYELNIQ